MSTTAAQEWWQQGLFEWQREALQGRQELATLRAQHQALLQALQDLLAAVGGPDGTSAPHRPGPGTPRCGRRPGSGPCRLSPLPFTLRLRRTVMVKVSMTAEEFDSLGERLGRLTPESVAIAREVLVDGVSRATVAERHGLTRPRITFIVDRVLAAAHDVPRDWVRVEVWLPPELAQQVREMEAKARARARDNSG
ncbi:TrfB-related DNA-binding protein [Azohydromonas australica]|uniref:TrfB-related DNA-binding protein n=1 Tax=Azohydromonas australica TaxID=364039 RepID=UPI000414EFEE|nr:TrfB-related DNA-binding protein [Azohydromonas australica]